MNIITTVFLKYILVCGKYSRDTKNYLDLYMIYFIFYKIFLLILKYISQNTQDVVYLWIS